MAASPPVLDLDALVAPIPESETNKQGFGNPSGNPAGNPDPPYHVDEELNNNRKELDENYKPLKPSWQASIEVATKTLTTTSKHLRVAIRLVEAVIREKGFPGLRDGLTVLARMYDECWFRMHPATELSEEEAQLPPKPPPRDEDDPLESRVKPLDGLKGAIPNALKNLPLLTIKREVYTQADWVGARKDEFAAKLGAVVPAEFTTLREDLAACRAALEQLVEVVDRRMPDRSIDLTSGPGTLGMALDQIMATVNYLSDKVPADPALAAAAAGAAAAEDQAAAGPAAGGPAAPVARAAGMDRADLYRQLEHIADTLQRLEPHSPIPYLLRRAVKLGALPFPQLMRAIVEESKPLDLLDKLLGIEAVKED